MSIETPNSPERRERPVGLRTVIGLVAALNAFDAKASEQPVVPAEGGEEYQETIKSAEGFASLEEAIEVVGDAGKVRAEVENQAYMLSEATKLMENLNQFPETMTPDQMEQFDNVIVDLRSKLEVAQLVHERAGQTMGSLEEKLRPRLENTTDPQLRLSVEALINGAQNGVGVYQENLGEAIADMGAALEEYEAKKAEIAVEALEM